jgi:hypothetical protein
MDVNLEYRKKFLGLSMRHYREHCAIIKKRNENRRKNKQARISRRRNRK